VPSVEVHQFGWAKSSVNDGCIWLTRHDILVNFAGWSLG